MRKFPFVKRRWVRDCAPPAAVIFAGLVALYPVTQNGFLSVGFDDPGFVTGVPTIGPWSWQRVRMCFDRLYLFDYLPLPMLSFLIDYQLWGLDPRGYHWTNLALHLIAALLVQRWVAATLKSRMAGFWAGLVFALHPVQVEAVAVVAQRKTLLSGVFLLLALLAYRRFLETFRGVWNWLGVTAFVAACLSKSSVVPFPLLLVLYDWLTSRQVHWKGKTPYVIVAAATALASIAAKTGAVIKPPHTESVWSTFLVMARVWWEYVLALFVPVGLSPSYYYRRAEIDSLLHYAAATALVVLTVALWRRRDSMTRTTFWWGWMFVALLPVANVVPIAVIRADRYLYIPMMAFALWVGSWFCSLGQLGWRRNTAVTVIVGLWCAALGTWSYHYAGVFRDDVRARGYVVERFPWAAPAHYLLARAWAERGEWDQARASALMALDRDPKFAAARELLAQLPPSGKVLRHLPLPTD